MQLNIEKLVYGGEGLARLPADEHGRGKAVFMPFVLEGEKVEASLVERKPGFARAHADNILTPSPHRIDAPCPYFSRCGGCHYQHSTYQHQLEIKAAILRESLRRIAKLDLETELIVHPSAEWNYRNRARLQVRSKPAFALGYYRSNSHDLLPVEQCPISSPLINQGIAALWRIGRGDGLHEAIQEIEFFANAEDNQLLAQVYITPGIPPDVAMVVAEGIKANLPSVTGVVLWRINQRSGIADQIATVGSPELSYRAGDLSYRVSAGAFFQVNRHLATGLLDCVTRGRSGAMALDLYAGVGLFSSVLARSFAQVIAVEPSPTSHADLLYNSPSNVKAIRLTTEQFLKTVTVESRPDFVVVDPPRSGLGQTVVQNLAGLGADRMVYVSCDPATLGRDLAGLLGAGYRIHEAHLLDLFPQTYHIESVFHLVR